MLRAILFDIDSVLIDTRRSNAAFYRSLLAKFRVDGPTDEEMRVFNHYSMHHFLRVFLKGEGEERLAAMWQAGQAEPYPKELVRAVPRMEDVVRQLGRQYALGLVSSRSHKGIDDAVAGMPTDIQTLFRARAGFEDTTEHKPRPAPILHALKLLGIQPKEAVYVGDAQTDVDAALAAGSFGISVGELPTTGQHIHIDHLADLPDAIQRIESDNHPIL